MLYIVQSGERKSAPVKIGYTQDFDRLRVRMKSLQTGNPQEIVLLAVIDGAGPQSEKLLHRTFARWRIRNEWFEYGSGIRRLVADALADPDLDVIRWARDYAEISAKLRRRFAASDTPSRRGERQRSRRAAFERQLADGSLTIRQEDAGE